jgi:hypothetical protein
LSFKKFSPFVNSHGSRFYFYFAGQLDSSCRNYSETTSAHTQKNLAPNKVVQIVGYCLSNIIYNLYFHPLAEFPGPLLARATLVRSPVFKQLSNIDGMRTT